MKILVLNAGSSSLKFQLFTSKTLSVAASGVVEQIAEEMGRVRIQYFDEAAKKLALEENRRIPDHHYAVQRIISLLQEKEILVDVNDLVGIGHRVVHGGEEFHQPVIITKSVIEAIRALTPLAPLHNPANLTGIEAVLKMAPNVPQVAVFDTAFHQSIPEHAYLYALPYKFYAEHKVRRYGFHGTSHSYVSRKSAEYLGRSSEELKIITLHLGNGASVAAIDRGCCVDTSMGMTPLEGLVMGTRSGDLDPAVVFYLARETGMDLDGLDALLNKESGLKGICGENDMRAIGKKAAAGDPLAKLAFEIFCYRIKKYVGAYCAVLGGVDCVVFTGGIGENDTKARIRCLHGLEGLGISVDIEKNLLSRDGILAIHRDESSCKVLVVPTDEEFEIATQTLSLIA